LSLPLEVRPEATNVLAELRRVPAGFAWMMGVALTLISAGAVRTGAISPAAAILVIALAWLVGLLILWQRNVRIFATEQRVGVVTALGRRRQFPRFQVHELRLQTVDYPGGLRYRYLLLLGDGHRRLTSVARGDSFPLEHLQQLADALNVPLSGGLDEPISEDEYNHRYPS
jgi:hypothetical protein